MKAVVNATPLIALSLTGHLDVLSQLFAEVYVPQSVYEEVVTQGRDRPGSSRVKRVDWLKIQQTTLTSPMPALLMGLDVGEQDVILLGQEISADWLIIDERLGRRIAQAMGFRVKGTLGILLIAYQAGLLSQSDAIKAAETLTHSSVRLSSKLLEWFNQQLERE
ncbi:nucleotide-binding protein [Leptolyngbya sp. BL0902]|uniref:DUF3368 domain-containing protein n=1 Tax=Leptolyngbya sp. BL0902 TaxID=1115757 RepID=UPI0018E73DCD|nr:DUF3368 domain-containing protein [Leptolyngbya sp. BL0902]QQE65895.1 nucleotide-binding protein [Leptolyngbya sp. BL0902]